MQALTEAACSTAHTDAPTKLPGAAHATVALLLSKGGREKEQQQHLGACQISGVHLRLTQRSGSTSVHHRQQPRPRVLTESRIHLGAFERRRALFQ